jgi:hypothetical protein
VQLPVKNHILIFKCKSFASKIFAAAERLNQKPSNEKMIRLVEEYGIQQVFK